MAFWGHQKRKVKDQAGYEGRKHLTKTMAFRDKTGLRNKTNTYLPAVGYVSTELSTLFIAQPGEMTTQTTEV